ncbi:MAG: hypothetical protein RR047_00975 [Bacilli bacterium]
MKKVVFLVISFFLLLTPTLIVSGSEFKDIPPTLNIEGINKEEYNINKEISGNKVIITLNKKESDIAYSWTFDRNKVGPVLNLNFELSLDSPKKDEIDSKSAANKDKTYVSFKHHGSLPSEATIKIYVGNRYQNGQKLYLYYYNENKKQIEYIDNAILVKNGIVEFKIDHCSEYFLTGAIVNDAANNPKSMNIIIIALVGIIVLLVGATVFSTKK